MNNTDKIKAEIVKQSPDWVLVSKLALELHNDTLESNFFKFKKGKINVVKGSEYNIREIKELLEDAMSGDNYEYLEVGSHSGLTVTRFNKLLNALSNTVNEKFVVVVTCKDQVVTNSIKTGLLVNVYNATMRDKWSKDVEKSIQLRNDELGFTFKAKVSEVKSQIRDMKLDEALAN
jgi:hypothetical protein